MCRCGCTTFATHESHEVQPTPETQSITNISNRRGKQTTPAAPLFSNVPKHHQTTASLDEDLVSIVAHGGAVEVSMAQQLLDRLTHLKHHLHGESIHLPPC